MCETGTLILTGLNLLICAGGQRDPHSFIFKSVTRSFISAVHALGSTDFNYVLLERGEGGRKKERERNINVWLPLVHPLLGTWPAIQVQPRHVP